MEQIKAPPPYLHHLNLPAIKKTASYITNFILTATKYQRIFPGIMECFVGGVFLGRVDQQFALQEALKSHITERFRLST